MFKTVRFYASDHFDTNIFGFIKYSNQPLQTQTYTFICTSESNAQFVRISLVEHEGRKQKQKVRFCKQPTYLGMYIHMQILQSVLSRNYLGHSSNSYYKRITST
jgi:hypothetical protein